VLSFDTVHAITDQLLAATTADLDPGLLSTAPTLLLLADQPAAPTSAHRRIRTLHIPLNSRTRPLPHLLHDTAQTLQLRGAAHPIMRAFHAARSVALAAADRRLLAWAVRYDDIDLTRGAPHLVRRVDAVDADGRVYQVSLRHAQTRPTMCVDDDPDPHDTPASWAGLTALITASNRLTGTEVPA
jgi:hypothetical protein